MLLFTSLSSGGSWTMLAHQLSPIQSRYIIIFLPSPFFPSTTWRIYCKVCSTRKNTLGTDYSIRAATNERKKKEQVSLCVLWCLHISRARFNSAEDYTTTTNSKLNAYPLVRSQKREDILSSGILSLLFSSLLFLLVKFQVPFKFHHQEFSYLYSQGFPFFFYW